MAQYRRGTSVLMVILAAWFGGCAREEPSPDAAVIVRVGDQAITVGEFKAAAARRRLSSVSSSPASDPDGMQARALLLEEMIETKALVQRARDEGLLADYELQYSLDRLVISRFEREALRAAGTQLAVSDQEVRQRYTEDPLLARPEKRSVAVVHVAVPGEDPEKRASARAKLMSAREEALALGEPVHDFGAVAARDSEDQATRYKGGRAGWVTQQGTLSRLDSAVVVAAFELEEEGDISDVIEAPDGLWLVRLVECQLPSRLPFETVAPNIRQRLAQEKQQAFFKQLRHEAIDRAGRSRVDTALLESVKLPDQPVPAVPVTPPSVPED